MKQLIKIATGVTTLFVITPAMFERIVLVTAVALVLNWAADRIFNDPRDINC